MTPKEFDEILKAASAHKRIRGMRYDVNVRMPEEMFSALVEYIDEQRSDMSTVCRHAVAEYLAARGLDVMPAAAAAA